MHQALIKYTVMRLALFVVVLIVLGLIVGPSFLLLVFSALISFALSYLFLRGPRDELTRAITERTEKRLNDQAASGRTGLDRSDDDIEDELAEKAIQAEERDQR